MSKNRRKRNFIYKIIDKDLKSGKYKSIHTRFAPEPNGYLHIGHAKSIYLNFGIANYYKGKCNLRFDDTNPVEENIEYIDSIKNDIKWLGFKWHGEVKYASNYFDKLYNYALELINKGLAYVDQLTSEEIRNYRGTLTKPGINSPYRNRSVKENILLFDKMRKGEFNEGSACLRAKIDMSSPDMIMRDPILYRIKFVQHHQTGNKWCIYPMYDFTHCISDAIEGITHSLCTLEFKNNRNLYNWILNNIKINNYPQQYEFSRLNLQYSIVSKRKLNLLLKKKVVDGWDDPRMPTISGMRRRGYTPSAIRKFCELVGTTEQDSNIEIALLESCIRKELNNCALRVMAVINPVLLIIESLPLGYTQDIVMRNHPNNLSMGVRRVTFSREIFIDRSDFSETKPYIGYKRLVLGEKVKLRNAYVIKANNIKKNNKGEVDKIFCHHFPETFGKKNHKEDKVNGIIHWVSATHSVAAEFRLYEKLFIESNPSLLDNFLSKLNPNSLITYYGFIETNALSPSFLKSSLQFEREGYFCVDERNFSMSDPVFNRIVGLKDNIKFKNISKV